MQKVKTCERLIALIVAIVILASPLIAQQRRAPAPKKPAATQAPEPIPTFDSLLSAESYRVYCEVRGVGQLIRSQALNDLLDPMVKLAGPPKEFKTVLKWLNAHAETLAGSRMLVASWPARTKLPNVLMAIEFSSPEEARKFEPELRGFIPTLAPTPTPTPVSSSGPGVNRAATSNASGPQSDSALPPYQIKQSGSLVLLSDQPFKFRDLTPRGSKLLAEEQNFAMARNRFASESLFIYVDVKSIEKEEQERAEKYEAERRRIENEAANRPREAEPPGDVNTQTTPEPTPAPAREPLVEEAPQPAPPPSGSPQATLGATASAPRASTSVTLSSSPDQSSADIDPMGTAMTAFYSGLFGGQPKWPEAVGAAIAFEGDDYVVRTLIVNGSDNKNNAIPFFPQFISGPALIPESPNILPADTDLFVTASLDYPQIYDAMLKAIAKSEELSRKYRREPARDSPHESPFSAYEKKLGLKIKDDLLPLFGNEIAFALSRKTSSASQSNTNAEPGTANVEQKHSQPAAPSPVIVISIKDKEAVRRLIPGIIESLAFKGADLLAQTEKRDETGITSYANILSYAFVGDFLVLSPDATATRHVVDSYLAHETLSADSHFRNSTGWQPRQVLGQVYLSPELMEQYNPLGAGANAATNEKMLDLLSRSVEPLTYALSNDGLGPLHELHLPKNLLLLMIAGMSSQASEASVGANEAIAKSLMRTMVSAEATFQATEGNGRYGTLDELLSAGLISKEPLQKYGYKIEIAVSGNRFEVTAVPIEYGKTGKHSYFIDESGVLRGGDHGGGAATLSDKPAE